MTVWQYLHDAPWFALAMALLASLTITMPIRYFFRHLNIRRNGWPPPHLDADGDLRDDEVEEVADLDDVLERLRSIERQVRAMCAREDARRNSL